ncbi:MULTISPECIES: sodium:calcium antiporter [Halococcus]|uniref:Na+/Ca2+-exchanging protein n=1 Tax=Halococcus salifodinae DSM 8989 TaxID=1227456 RepID=M0NES4_9EURY|nr:MULTISPECIES: sodium:calcium antiporter [Halococcus]EMA55579.1 Na+/Ca2+-exchanging protein [Halococcus salifodinae DSM 8989]
MSATQVALYAVIAVVATAGVWKGSSLLERASDRLSTYYGLPAVVQGAIVAAVGSSFPELSAAVLSTLLHGEFDLGVSAIVGSAVFNILVIPALSGYFSRGDLEADRTLVYKEAQFYMLAVAGLLITFALAVIYNPTTPGSLVGTVTRPLALAPLALYALYVFIQYQDVIEHESTEPTDGINVVREWAVLAVSLVVIVIAVEGLVRAAIGFGDLFDTPSFIWGLTVVAAGTSLPDAFVSVKAAKRGEGVTSLANVLGSNTFDLLVAVPAGVLVAGTAPIDFAATVPMMAFLTVATLVLFTVLRTDLTLTGREGGVLLGVYGVFVGWLVLETIGVLGFIPGV